MKIEISLSDEEARLLRRALLRWDGVSLLPDASREEANLLPAFREGLDEEGFVEGRDVAIEQRYADNRPDRLPALADDLVRRKVSVIVGNGPAMTAARAATATA